MVQPSAALGARLRFTTKSVGRGFYRGNRTGSMGSHTQYGGYLIDWRKTRSFNVPDLAGFKLTPYVTREINPKQEPEIEEQIDPTDLFLDADHASTDFTPVSVLSNDSNKLKKDLLKHLTAWRRANPEEFAQRVEEQFDLKAQAMQDASKPTNT